MQTTARMTILVVAFVAVCCGGNSATTPTPTTLAGTWKATRAEFVNASNSSQRVEAIAQGYTITLTLESGGTYTQQTTDPGQPTQTTTGTWSASKDVLTMKPTGQSGDTQFDMTLNGSTLTLNGGHVLFDVNNDDHDEEAILNMTLARQ
jgi:hypothetical protein